MQSAVIIDRDSDWWTSATTSFRVSWDRSANKQQDGLVHMESAYQMSQLTALAWDWTCVGYETAGWLGAVSAVAISLPKEIGDGLHEGRFFSLRDLTWTISGAALPAVHRMVPATLLLHLKAWYWPSEEFRNRSSGELPQLENDYAGQRYFLSLIPGRYPASGEEIRRAPVGIAFGHGIQSWITERPVHEWYLTLDLNFRGLPIRGRTWHRVATILDQIHFPFPGLRLRRSKLAVGFF